MSRDAICLAFCFGLACFYVGLEAGQYVERRDHVDPRMDKCKPVASIKGKMFYNCAGEIVRLERTKRG